MRNAIKEYLSYSDDEKLDLWNHATFVFDTNVLLNLYRYSDKTRKSLLTALNKLQERLWMPNHVAQEFMKNRKNAIWGAIHQYEDLQHDADKFIASCASTVKLEKSDADIEGLHKQITEWIDAAKKKNILVSDLSNDSILDQLLILYDGKVGPSFTDEERKKIESEGKVRFEAEIPPGYKDREKQKGENKNNTYGDLIIWKQILNYASAEKKDIIVVTNDQKEDWWEILHGQTIGPRVELRKEFIEQTSQRFHMYSLQGFITQFDNESDTKIDKDTIAEIESLLNVPPEEIHEQSFRDYYYTRDGDLMLDRVRKTRYELMRIEDKNKKRQRVIHQIREKYDGKSMPKDIESMFENTITNYERDKKLVEKLQAELYEISYRLTR